MKLEKQEISLNEKDSLTDAFYTEKSLLFSYVNALEKVCRNETRKELTEKIKEVCEDLFFINDLMTGNVEKET